MSLSVIQELIQRRRLQLLVHSFLYYQLNENIIDDSTYDRWSKELVDLTEKYPVLAQMVIYHKEFESFDGSSGFDLPYHHPAIQSRARKLLAYHRENKQEVVL